MNLPDGSCLIGDGHGSYLVGMNLSDDSCPSGISLRDRPEANAYVIVLEYGLPSSEHTDEGLRVKGTFIHSVETNNSMFGDDPECFVGWPSGDR